MAAASRTCLQSAALLSLRFVTCPSHRVKASLSLSGLASPDLGLGGTDLYFGVPCFFHQFREASTASLSFSFSLASIYFAPFFFASIPRHHAANSLVPNIH